MAPTKPKALGITFPLAALAFVSTSCVEEAVVSEVGFSMVQGQLVTVRVVGAVTVYVALFVTKVVGSGQ